MCVICFVFERFVHVATCFFNVFTHHHHHHQVLYAEAKDEVINGEVMHARERAMAELPGIEYKQTKSTVRESGSKQR